MKLKSRRRRDKMKLRPRLAAARALLRSAPLRLSIPATLPLPPPHHSVLSSSTPPHQPPSSSVGRHVSGEQYSPAISSPAVLLLPSFFIKLPKQKSVAVVTWRSTRLPTQLAGPAVACGRLARRTLVLHQIRCRGSSPVLMASSPQQAEP